MYLVSQGLKTPQTNSIDLSCPRCSNGDKQHHLDSSDESEMDAPVSIMQQSAKMNNLASASATPTEHTNHSSLNLNMAPRGSGGAAVSDSTSHMQHSAHHLSSIMANHNPSTLTSSSSANAANINPQHTHHQLSGIPSPLSAVAAYNHLHSVMGSTWSDYQNLWLEHR